MDATRSRVFFFPRPFLSLNYGLDYLPFTRLWLGKSDGSPNIGDLSCENRESIQI